MAAPGLPGPGLGGAAIGSGGGGAAIGGARLPLSCARGGELGRRVLALEGRRRPALVPERHDSECQVRVHLGRQQWQRLDLERPEAAAWLRLLVLTLPGR